MARTSVTIKDVAREARVSVATVSRALNGHENVAESVRQQVLATADRLRYQPHAAARSLSSRRTQTIGVVLPDLYGEFFSELIRGIDQAARRNRHHVLVSGSHSDPAELEAMLRALRGRVDGLVIMAPDVNAYPLIARFGRAVPTVLMLTTAAPARSTSAVKSGSRAAALAATGDVTAGGVAALASDNAVVSSRL